MIAGAVFVMLYTFIGGFLAESASDFMQSVVMIFALRVILTTGTIAAGGPARGDGECPEHPRLLQLLRHRQPVTVETACSRWQTARPSSARRAAMGC